MTDLYLWRLVVEPARLARIAREHRIPAKDEDCGYAVHALLKGLYGDAAPKPWRFEPRSCLLWAYAAATPVPPDSAAPLYRDAVAWDRSGAKSMPVFSAGRRVAFDLRACPLVRHGSRGEDRAAEHDYLLWRARRNGVEPSSLDPRKIYADWLRDEKRWPADVGAILDENTIAVTGWSKPLTSGTGATSGGKNAWRGHKGKGVCLPNVSFTGTFIVNDANSFTAFLARGVGRHRAFGYGMLLLRPAT